VPNIGERIHYVIAVIVVVSVLPVVISIMRARRAVARGEASRRGGWEGSRVIFDIGRVLTASMWRAHERDGFRKRRCHRRNLVGHRKGSELDGLAGSRISARDCIYM